MEFDETIDLIILKWPNINFNHFNICKYVWKYSERGKIIWMNCQGPQTHWTSQKLDILRESHHFPIIFNTWMFHLIGSEEGIGKDNEPRVGVLVGSATTNSIWELDTLF